jgi:type IV pilus assembly protein PilQ
MNRVRRRPGRSCWLFLSLMALLVMAGCATKGPGEPAAVTAEPMTAERFVQGVDVNEEDAAVVVTIQSNQPLTYSAIKRVLPPGVVMYFPDTSLQGVEELYTPESTLIKSIATSQPAEQGGASRIQINLAEDARYNITQDQNQITVRLDKPGNEPAPVAEAAAPAPKEMKGSAVQEPQQAVVSEKAAEASTEQPQAAGDQKMVWVNRVNFIELEQGRSRVMLGTTGRVAYETDRPSPDRVILRLLHARIPKHEMRALITTRFKSAVDRVVPIQTPAMGDTALIAVQLREAVPYRVEQKDNLLIVDFEASTVPPRPLPDVQEPEWQRVMEGAAAPPAVSMAQGPVESGLSFGREKKVYTGQKISLDFQDADIRDVFRILHEISGKNFVIGDDVKGRVTLKLDNVPWDQVLDLITRMNQLGTTEEGNIVRIATLSTLEAEKKATESNIEAEKNARKAQEELEPLVTEYIPINYSDAAVMIEHLEDVKSERGKLSFDKRTNMIIMTDAADKVDRARQVVKKLDVVTRQVLIESRIVEASTSFSREIGIQWGGDYATLRSSDVLGGVYGFKGPLDDGGKNWVVNLPATGATSGIEFGFQRFAGGLTSLTLNAILTAMEVEGEIKIISSPKIVTLDNKEAYIKQGQRIPFTKDEEGTITTEFVDAVLSLTVTPHVTMDDRIALNVLATKDEPDFSQTSIAGEPLIDTKEANTELLVNNGETIVIGGIIKENQIRSQQNVPWLGQMPVLGWLFKSQGKVADKRELLIFITTTIVKLEEGN